MRVSLLLLSYAHGRLRHQNGKGKHRCTVPGVKLAPRTQTDPDGVVLVAGVIEVAVRHASVDSLTPLSPNAELLCRYYGADVIRLGAVDCQILHRHKFEEPQELTHIAARSRLGGSPIPVYTSTRTQLCIPLSLSSDLPVGPSASWGSGRPRFAVMLPDVIVDRVFANVWHDVVLLRVSGILDDVLPSSAFGTVAEAVVCTTKIIIIKHTHTHTCTLTGSQPGSTGSFPGAVPPTSEKHQALGTDYHGLR